MKPAIYLRTSSEMQRDGNGADAQAAAIAAWFTLNGVDIQGARRFEDAAVSGKSMKRPGWQAMIEAVRAGEVDTVVVYDLSRCGRTLRGLIEWAEEMVERGIRVVFVKDGIDISTAMGRFILQIMGAVAEMERHRIAGRIRDGVRAKIAKGQRWGGGRVVDASRRGCSRLTAEQWQAAKARLDAGEAASSVAADYPISANALGKRAKRAK